jgi:hypothetical protein
MNNLEYKKKVFISGIFLIIKIKSMISKFILFVFAVLGINCGFSQVGLKPSGQITYPFKYGNKIKSPYEDIWYSTVILEGRNMHYILTDSIDVKLKNTSILKFYFMTPLLSEFNIQCPEEFGFIVVNESGYEVYSDFNSGYNSYSTFHQFNLKDQQRNLLGLGISGCGSGYWIMYFDVFLDQSSVTMKEAIRGFSAGYTTVLFLEDKNMYVRIERLNPACHFSCSSKYQLTYFDLSDDHLISERRTKYVYEDFNDIGEEELIRKIRSREPGLILF